MQRFFFFQAEDGIRDSVASRGLGNVYKRQVSYRFNEQLRLNLALKNIFDRDYVTARGGLGDYQAIGREAMLTITYTPK